MLVSAADLAKHLGDPDMVVLHVPRGMDDTVRLGLGLADVVVMVLGLDVLSFRAAKRVVDALGLDDRCSFVVNRASRREISPRYLFAHERALIGYRRRAGGKCRHRRGCQTHCARRLVHRAWRSRRRRRCGHPVAFR